MIFSFENFKSVLRVAKTLAGFGGVDEKAIHSGVQSAVTYPSISDLKKVCGGMSKEQFAEAVRLRDIKADAESDFVVYVASQGEIPADE